MLKCDECGMSQSSRGRPFRSKQGLLGHKRFAHPECTEQPSGRAECTQGRLAPAQQQVAYKDLEEERDALLEEVEGLQDGARQLKVTLAQAVALATTEQEDNKVLRQERDALRDELERLKAEAEARLAQAPAHPPGLCGETSCESCVGQGQEIANAAYARGREAVSTYLDESLVAADRLHPVPAGGEPLRERVARALYLNQPITIIDDR